MSGSSNPLYVAPPDPLGALLKFAQGQQAQAAIGQTQAQTGLLGAQTGLTQQQTTGAELNNQQLQLMLGLRGALANSILPGSAPQSGNLPSQGGAPSGLPPAAIGGPAAGGQAATNGQSAVAAADAQLPPAVTPFGATMSPFGVPLPRAQMIAAVMSGDPLKGVTDAYNMGRQRIVSELNQAQNPQQAQAAAMQLYQEGWLDQRGYANLYNNPAGKQAFLDSMASPDAHMSQFTALTGQGLSKDENGNVQINPTAVAAKFATSAAEAGGKVGPAIEQAIGIAKGTLPYDVQKTQAGKAGETKDFPVTRNGVTVNVTGVRQADGSWRAPDGTVLAPAPAMNAPGTTQAPPLSAATQPGATMSQDDWAAKVLQTEGGVGATDTGSSAQSGFLGGTWVDQVRKNRPDVTQGKTDAEVLAMRNDPALVKQMTLAYANENAPILQKANIHPDATTLRMADWFGPAGVQKIFNAPAGTPMGQIIDADTLKRNGISPTLTNSQLWGQVGGQFGHGDVPGITPGTPLVAAPGAAAASAVTTPPAAPEAAPVVTAPRFARLTQLTQPAPATSQGPEGVGVSIPKYSTVQEHALNKLSDDVAKYQDAAQVKADAANNTNNIIDQIRLESQSWTSGPFADVKMRALGLLDSLRQNVNAAVGKEVMGAPDQSVGDYTGLIKNTGELVRQAVRATSPRAAVQEFLLVSKTVPGEEISPQAMRLLTAQMQGMNDWAQAKSQAAGTLPRSGPNAAAPNVFDAEWNRQVDPIPFILQRMQPADRAAMVVKMPAGLREDVAQQVEYLAKNGFMRTAPPIPTGRQFAPGQ